MRPHIPVLLLSLTVFVLKVSSTLQTIFQRYSPKEAKDLFVLKKAFRPWTDGRLQSQEVEYSQLFLQQLVSIQTEWDPEYLLQEKVYILSLVPQKVPLFNSNFFTSSSMDNSNAWMSRLVSVPNPSDHLTVLMLAKICQDAYLEQSDQYWNDVPGWNVSLNLGWEADTVRGYIFANSDDSVVVISLKGTSTSLFGVGGGPTSANDKSADNLMFSCCCGYVDRTWINTVCSCYNSTHCNTTCLHEESSKTSTYYNIAMSIYESVEMLYPNAEIFLTGHSLGGALSALIALAKGKASYSFESPGDLAYAKRLRLPIPSDMSSLPIYHYGHNADPIYIGECQGISSVCYYDGYAMETMCHLGNACLYDVINSNRSGSWFPWRVDIRHHRLNTVVDHILTKWDEVPTCAPEVNCTECGGWSYWEG